MLKDHVAIVTGSTSGIGLAIAKTLAGAGAHIMLNGFARPEEVEAVKKEVAACGVKVDYSGADMSKPAEIRAMVAQAEKTFGKVDILVNNAGIQFTAPIDEFPEDKWDAIIAINLSACFHALKAVLPGMKSRNYGRVINIASAHGLVASPNKSAYVTAKHGLVGMTKAVAVETAEHNITCNAVCPGWVDTPLVRKQIEDRAKAKGTSLEEEEKSLIGEKQPNKRFATADNIADLVLYLARPASTAMTGSAYSIDGGWTAW